jgi:hypothetical protein
MPLSPNLPSRILADLLTGREIGAARRPDRRFYFRKEVEMARPKGHPKSGGRKRGSRNKATLVREQELAAGGERPVDYMLRVMRDPKAENSRRDDMAKAAAPFVHHRLATVQHGGSGKNGEIETVLRVEFVRGVDGRPALPALRGTKLPAIVEPPREKLPAVDRNDVVPFRTPRH